MGTLRSGGAAICGWLLSLSAGAVESDQLLMVYGKLYPEWQVQRFGQPTTAGTVVGTLGTLRNDTVVLSRTPAVKPDADDHAWSNSYVGVKGVVWRSVQLTLGYDLQLEVDLQGDQGPLENVADNLETRDAFVYVDSPALGQLALGKMDSIYKEWGDRIRMFGISSGNIVSTSKLLSGVGWRASGGTSFHNRRSHMLGWFGPSLAGFELGITHSYDEQYDGPGGPDTTLSAVALRWRSGPWYLAWATEIHRDWLPMSRGANPAATSILNTAASTRSRDQAWRLSAYWSDSRWRWSADVARLSYEENDTLEVAGKFRAYRNYTWQVSAEYKGGEQWRFGANLARADAGRCVLSGGIACTTTGLGSTQISLGAIFQLSRNASLFGLASAVRNRDAARYWSTPLGASLQQLALGVKFEFN